MGGLCLILKPFLFITIYSVLLLITYFYVNINLC